MVPVKCLSCSPQAFVLNTSACCQQEKMHRPPRWNFKSKQGILMKDEGGEDPAPRLVALSLWFLCRPCGSGWLCLEAMLQSPQLRAPLQACSCWKAPARGSHHQCSALGLLLRRQNEPAFRLSGKEAIKARSVTLQGLAWGCRGRAVTASWCALALPGSVSRCAWCQELGAPARLRPADIFRRVMAEVCRNLWAYGSRMGVISVIYVAYMLQQYCLLNL